MRSHTLLVETPAKPRGRTVRAGVTLLEILVSIFILSVGLLGVAALIPVGNSEVTKGAIAHRAAETGLRAFREMKLRGYLDPENWLYSGQSVVDPETGVMKTQFAGQPFAIDPLTSAIAGGGTIGQTKMKVFSIRSTFATEGSTTAPQMPQPMAERIFVGQDNLTFDRPDDQTLMPKQFSTGSGARRRTERMYSWMATLVPMQVLKTGSLPGEFKLDTYLMSAVVFYRDLPIEGKARQGYTMSAEPLGGSEFRLQMGQGIDPDDAKKLLRPRRWIMLTDNDRVYRWYRIGSVEGTEAEDRSDRVVSLVGPDWDSGTKQPPTAVVYDGVVGVVEKMVQLEGQTMWSPGSTPAGRKK
jgi:hypothetical protein